MSHQEICVLLHLWYLYILPGPQSQDELLTLCKSVEGDTFFRERRILSLVLESNCKHQPTKGLETCLQALKSATD